MPLERRYDTGPILYGLGRASKSLGSLLGRLDEEPGQNEARLPRVERQGPKIAHADPGWLGV